MTYRDHMLKVLVEELLGHNGPEWDNLLNEVVSAQIVANRTNRAK